jgi:hypothetical protein
MPLAAAILRFVHIKLIIATSIAGLLWRAATCSIETAIDLFLGLFWAFSGPFLDSLSPNSACAF